MLDGWKVLRPLVDGLGRVGQELSNGGGKSIDTGNNSVQFLVIARVMPRYFRGSAKELGKEAEMIGPLLVDRAVPVMMVTERARPSVLSTIAVEAREAVVALNRIGGNTRRRRSGGLVADACHVFVGGRRVVAWSTVIQNVAKRVATVDFAMLFAVPGKLPHPLAVKVDLLADLVESGEDEHVQVLLDIIPPPVNHLEELSNPYDEMATEDLLPAILQVNGDLRGLLEFDDLSNLENLVAALAQPQDL